MRQLLTCALAAFLVSASSSAAAAQEKKASEPAAPAGKYYEMRIYTVAEGKMDALNARFRDHTLRLFKRHGIESVGYWTAVDEKNKGKLYFVIAYPDKASRDKLWTAFTSDPDWKAAAKASEANGKLVEKAEQVFMYSTDYSPAK